MKANDAFAYLLIIIMLACECSLFYLSFLPDSFFEVCGYNAKYLSSAFAVLGFLAVFPLAGRMSKRRGFAFGIPIASFVIMCVVMAFVSSFVYNIELRAVLLVAMPSICMPLLYFALNGMVANEGLYDFFIGAMIFFAAAYAILCLLEAMGVSIMNEAYQYTSLRNGRLRVIVSGDFVTFGAVLALGRAFATKKHRVLNFGLFAIMAFEVYWVAQTRFLIIGLAAAVSVGFVIGGRNKTVKILLLVFTVIMVFSQFSSQLTAILFPSELSASSTARVNAYSYYWSHAADLGIFGIGFIPSGSSRSFLLDMVTTFGFERGDITDIGIVGYLARYGICGAAVLVMAIIWFLRTVGRRDRETFRVGANPEAWMTLALFVAICPTMAITDAQRIFYLPIVALMVEHAVTSRP